jgi:hypothetical protein
VVLPRLFTLARDNVAGAKRRRIPKARARWPKPRRKKTRRLAGLSGVLGGDRAGGGIIKCWGLSPAAGAAAAFVAKRQPRDKARFLIGPRPLRRSGGCAGGAEQNWVSAALLARRLHAVGVKIERLRAPHCRMNTARSAGSAPRMGTRTADRASSGAGEWKWGGGGATGRRSGAL